MKGKLFFLAALLLLSYQSWAQMPKDPETGLFTYTGVIEAPGKKDQLYFRVKQWIVFRGDEYENAVSQVYRLTFIQIEDGTRVQGKFSYVDIDAVGSVLGSKTGTEVWGHFMAEVKDGKVKYTFTDFHAVYENSETKTKSNVPLEKSTFKGIIKRGAEYMPMLVENLKIYLNVKYDEW